MPGQLIYDTEVLYNQHMGDGAQKRLMEFYDALFSGYGIKTIHDCTIGAGGTTLPLSKLGYEVSGSDLSENLLGRAALNFSQGGFTPELFTADLRYIGEMLGNKVDCMMSTGNSLPHVNLDGFCEFLKSARGVLNERGLLFFDIRNWDAIVKQAPVIHARDPFVMTADEHRSLYLLFNWHDDGSVTFSFATSIDKYGKHVSMDVIKCPVYYPLLRNDIAKSLEAHGYELIKFIDMDSIWIASSMAKDKCGDFERDFDNIQWYGVLARVGR